MNRLLLAILALATSVSLATSALAAPPSLDPLSVSRAAPAASAPLAVDLELVSFSAPPSGQQTQDLGGTLSAVFRNDGPDTLLAPLPLLSVTISSDTTGGIASADRVVTICGGPGRRIAPGESITVDFSACARPIVPLLAETGPQWIYAELDPAGQLAELDEANNRIVLPFTVTPISRSAVYFEDWQLGPSGWTTVDLVDKAVHLHRLAHDGPGGPRGVWWCGAENPAWAASPGYARHWNQALTKGFALPATGPLSLEYVLQYDTEPLHDLVRVEISLDGGTSFLGLRALSGSTDGAFTTFSEDLAPFAGQEVQIRFRFTSDSRIDDADGGLDTDGAFRLDEVAVSGHPRDTFETGEDGWVPSIHDAPIAAALRLEADPACGSPWPCHTYPDGQPLTACNAWVAYDPATGEFPEISAAERADGHVINVGLESPVISVPTDMAHLLLGLDVFSDQPLASGVFYTWAISSPAGAPWRSVQTVFYGDAGWRHRTWDISSFVPAGATTMRLRLEANDYGYLFGHDPDSHGAGPFFDNVTIWATETESPGVHPVPAPCGATVADHDGDGVLDQLDACPTENAARFDRDGDGCLDPVIGARHVEYWPAGDLPLPYAVHEGGAPGIGDGSDLAAIEAGFAAWTALPGAELSVQFLGTTPQADAQALDLVNLVTFADPDYVFPSGVLGVGLTTSFTTPVWEPAAIRPGQIVDCDMILNPAYGFATATQGSGTDLRSLVTHEAGHMLGLAHSAVVTSTMHYVLRPGDGAASLTVEDELAMLRAYPSAATVAATSHLTGTIHDGRTGLPVGGVAVFAIAAATGDTLGCDYSLPADGGFHFIGLPGGDYWVAIHPLDGTSAIAYLEPGYINDLVEAGAATTVVPEWWDADESSADDPAARTAIAVAAGAAATAALITNIDTAGPAIVALSPAADAADVAVEAAILVRFDEAIDGASLRGNFNLSTAPGGPLVPGNAALVEDGRTLAYVPAASLGFETTYFVVVRAGVKDRFGNPLGADLTASFTTGPRPPIYLASLSPRKGPAGSVLVLTGAGFAADAGGNTVRFGAETLPVLQASPTQLVVGVPAASALGAVAVSVTNQALPAPETSNELAFTVLAPETAPRGTRIAAVDLGALPRSLAVSPDGARVFIATAAGLSIVDVSDPTAPVHTPLAVAGGLNEVDVAPGGQTVFAVGSAGGTLCRFQVEPPLLLNETPVGAEPRGLLIDPSGRRAYVPTDAGQIQLWDVREGSATYETRLGALAAPDLNLTGRLAIEPAGSRLLALSGTGEVLVYDLGPDTLRASVPVLSQPRDLKVDAAGEILYVADESGAVSLVALQTLNRFLDVPTGGALRALDLSGSGAFVYTADRQLDYLDVLDLRAGSPAFRQVAARIPQPASPVDLAFSPDGDYVYVLADAGRQLVICAAGAGPLLSSLTPRAGAAGAKVVLAGAGMTGGRVLFGDVEAAVERGGDGFLVVSVPAGAGSGLVTVLGSSPGEVSNPLAFSVLGPTPAAGFRPQAAAAPAGGRALSGALAVAPDGGLLALGTESGEVHLLDIDPGSGSFYGIVGQVPALAGAVRDIAFSPDAKRAYAVARDDASVIVIDTDPAGGNFAGIEGSIALAGATPSRLAAGPDGRVLAVADSSLAAVYLNDLTGDFTATVPLPGGPASEVAFHPAGALAYAAVAGGSPATIQVLDGDVDSPSFGTVVGSAVLPGAAPAEVPLSLSFSPDGTRCFVLTSQIVGAPNRTLVTLDTSVPAAPVVLATVPFAGPALPMAEHLRVAPAGDRAVLGLRDSGLHRLSLPAATALEVIDPAFDAQPFRFAYDTEGARLFVAATATDSVHVYDFGAGLQIAKVWGDGQVGSAGQPLPSPLRVRVTDPATGSGAPGIPVAFRVLAGAGHFATSVPGATPLDLVVGTDAYGYAQASWVLGPALGDQTAQAGLAAGAAASLAYAATAVVDPETQPLAMIDGLLAPGDGATGVGVTTAVQAVFSRPVDPASATATAFYLSADGGATGVPVTLGFAAGNRRLSLTPLDDLAFGATYTVVVRGALRDGDGGLLQNPSQTTFTTAAPPPAPVLVAVSPPSATPTVGVILSGTGFDPAPAMNTVWFNDVQAVVTDAASDWVRAVVPIGAASGAVRLETGGQTTGSLPFAVLAPSTSPPDEVVRTAGTGSATRGVTVSPDGAVLYAVSPEADLVVPVVLETLSTLPGIPVGDEPWALVVHPDGGVLYVANRLSGDVSIVDIDLGSATSHEVVGTLEVGTYPVDIAVTPAGDRVLVANAGSQDLSIIDSDDGSSSYHRVIATSGTGSAARGVTVSPDGALIYVGTDAGYIVVDPVSFGVLRSVGTGTAAKSVSVSPDGALLVLVDTQGDVWVYDVAEGSDRQDQVVATAGTGSAVRSASVSPDGALLYLLLEEGDTVLAFTLDVGASVGVIGPDAAAPPRSLQLVATLTAGDDPADIAFDPTGTGAFYVSNAGDGTISVFGGQAPAAGKVAGCVYADCPIPGTGLFGVEVDVYVVGTGELARSLQTDLQGRYEATLAAGDYILSLVTPLGYLAPLEETSLSIGGGDSVTVDWPVRCIAVAPSQRMLSFWKHQVGIALNGHGSFEIDATTLCDYLDLIEVHFNSNLVNPVVVYTPPASDLCRDKLEAARELLNLEGDEDMLSHAKQEFMAVLLNVAAQKLGLLTVISTDGAPVSRAITYLDRLIDDGVAANDEQAMKIAKDINKGKLVGFGLIPPDLPDISYAPKRFALGPSRPNPFNPATIIGFDIAAPGRVRLRVYDLAGRLVRTLVDEVRQPGAYTALWNGRDDQGRAAASGVYFYRLEAGDHRLTRKMMMVK